jgi:L-fuculose-phosphate aldolase
VANHNLFLLANHGAVAVGSDLYQASFRLEALEQAAKIAIVARQLGGAHAIEEAELAKLRQLREDLGLAPGPHQCLAAEGRCPRAAEDEGLIARITDLVIGELAAQGRG